MDYSDNATDNRYLLKTATPLLQRLIKPNKSEEEDNDLEEETKNALFMLRNLISRRRIDPEMIRACTTPPPQIAMKDIEIAELKEKLAEKEATIVELTEKLNTPQIRVLAAEFNRQLAEKDAEIAELQRIAPSVTETAKVASSFDPLPALAELRVDMNRAGLKLAKLLMAITADSDAEDRKVNVQERVGLPKRVIKTWYEYRREGREFARDEFAPECLDAMQIMDAIYLAFTNPSDGRKAVQDVINHKWWKSIYPHCKVTLQNGSKISFNTEPS